MSLKTKVLESFLGITINEHIYRKAKTKRSLLDFLLSLSTPKIILLIHQKNTLRLKAEENSRYCY